MTALSAIQAPPMVIRQLRLLPQTYGLNAPWGYPLNSYGSDYKAQGGHPAIQRIVLRVIRPIRLPPGIETLNSDGDSKINIDEIKALTFPGSASDSPGLVPAPAVGLNMERILKLPDYSEFLLLNASKSQDFYATYGSEGQDLLNYVQASKEATILRSFRRMVSLRNFHRRPDQHSRSSVQCQGSIPTDVPRRMNFADYSFIPNRLKDGDRILRDPICFSRT